MFSGFANRAASNDSLAILTWAQADRRPSRSASSICDKRSRDGSGKCTIRHTGSPSDVVHGVLFTIPQSQVPSLDQAEGEGTEYDRVLMQAETKNDQILPTDTYIAKEEKIHRRAIPYDWYLNLILTGAELHGLPKAYIDKLRTVRALPDPMPQRRERFEALKQLGTSE
jgi:gamma-glutamylcyclotransferase